MEILLIVLWIALSVGIGIAGSKKKIGGWVSFAIAFVPSIFLCLILAGLGAPFIVFTSSLLICPLVAIFLVASSKSVAAEKHKEDMLQVLRAIQQQNEWRNIVSGQEMDAVDKLANEPVNLEEYQREESSGTKRQKRGLIALVCVMLTIIVVCCLFVKKANNRVGAATVTENTPANDNGDGQDYTVTVERAYFYSSPNMNTRKSGYLLKGEHVRIIDGVTGFFSIVFRNERGAMVNEWVRKEDVTQGIIQLPTPPNVQDDRKELLDALRSPVELELHQSVKFVVKTIQKCDNWALVTVTPVQPDGAAIDYKNTQYEQYVNDGAFENNISSLLKRKDGRWLVAEMQIGATDSPIQDWIAKYDLEDCMSAFGVSK